MKHGGSARMVVSQRRPDIHVAPPLVFATGFAAGFFLDRLVRPLSVIGSTDSVRLAGVMAGVVFILLGIALALWGVLVFRRAKTTILPFRASTAIVQNGPYRFTRNPMYVGMTFGYVGAALLLNTWWPLVLLPLVLLAMVRLVIVREEAFLRATFGAEYADYTKQVRRWL
jgi:protein-S-isoprenylcysteine O-methyltransferase Ste14